MKAMKRFPQKRLFIEEMKEQERRKVAAFSKFSKRSLAITLAMMTKNQSDADLKQLVKFMSELDAILKTEADYKVLKRYGAVALR